MPLSDTPRPVNGDAAPPCLVPAEALEGFGVTPLWDRHSSLTNCPPCNQRAGCLRHAKDKDLFACRFVEDHLGVPCTAPDGTRFILFHAGRLRQAVEAEIHRTLEFLHPTGVIEIRILDARDERGRKFDAAGYFDSPAKAARQVAEYEMKHRPGGIYVLLNPVHPSTLARSPNRITHGLAPLASVNDILRLRWLFIDLDPVRPAGVPSTNEELLAAKSPRHTRPRLARP